MIEPPSVDRGLSVEEIRGRFPALARTEAGSPVAYFDGPGGTQVPRSVAAAVEDYLFHHNANTHWAYPDERRDRRRDRGGAARSRRVRQWVAPEEIVFGANMTTLTFHLARALGRRWRPGDEIVVTELDHHANVDPWRDVARERGSTVRTVAMRPDSGQIDEESLAGAIGPRTKLVAIGGASNALGTVNPVARWATLAREKGALVFVDAVHSAPHVLPDVRAIGCDFLVVLGIQILRSAHRRSLGAPRSASTRSTRRGSSPLPTALPSAWKPERRTTRASRAPGAAVDFLASLAGENGGGASGAPS